MYEAFTTYPFSGSELLRRVRDQLLWFDTNTILPSPDACQREQHVQHRRHWPLPHMCYRCRLQTVLLGKRVGGASIFRADYATLEAEPCAATACLALGLGLWPPHTHTSAPFTGLQQLWAGRHWRRNYHAYSNPHPGGWERVVEVGRDWGPTHVRHPHRWLDVVSTLGDDKSDHCRCGRQAGGLPFVPHKENPHCGPQSLTTRPRLCHSTLPGAGAGTIMVRSAPPRRPPAR